MRASPPRAQGAGLPGSSGSRSHGTILEARQLDKTIAPALDLRRPRSGIPDRFRAFTLEAVASQGLRDRDGVDLGDIDDYNPLSRKPMNDTQVAPRAAATDELK